MDVGYLSARSITASLLSGLPFNCWLGVDGCDLCRLLIGFGFDRWHAVIRILFRRRGRLISQIQRFFHASITVEDVTCQSATFLPLVRSHTGRVAGVYSQLVSIEVGDIVFRIRPIYQYTVFVIIGTHDFEVAIEEGATIVRVGSAIFGERQRPAVE